MTASNISIEQLISHLKNIQKHKVSLIDIEVTQDDLDPNLNKLIIY